MILIHLLVPFGYSDKIVRLSTLIENWLQEDEQEIPRAVNSPNLNPINTLRNLPERCLTPSKIGLSLVEDIGLKEILRTLCLRRKLDNVRLGTGKIS
ncbi:hypothetical protein AVEN_233763-1 [Araneus ventricosus]|uniref:Uncharacterized protein n=1 Tax=Araneus ventricosus TaxID=182803 RepID=A0A4Y2P4B9_ARAVE|nr:hypothetical protein AVEN_233763-1 [Araneus ventricosus]